MGIENETKNECFRPLEDVETMRKLSERSPHMYECIMEAMETHVSKSHDYAVDSDPFYNFKRICVMCGNLTPLQACEVFIAVKKARLEALLDGDKKPDNESIDDTFKDRAVYALIAWALYREQCKDV